MMEMFRRRRIEASVNAYADQMISGGVSSHDACVLHLMKVQLERDFERKVRSIQTLLDLNQPEAVTCTIKELNESAASWPTARDAHAKSDFLLRLLHTHLPKEEWSR